MTNGQKRLDAVRVVAVSSCKYCMGSGFRCFKRVCPRLSVLRMCTRVGKKGCEIENRTLVSFQSCCVRLLILYSKDRYDDTSSLPHNGWNHSHLENCKNEIVVRMLGACSWPLLTKW